MAITFEFINTSVNDRGKNGRTRSKVRAQAMRNFRQRQRDAREAEKPTTRTIKPRARKRSLDAAVSDVPDAVLPPPDTQDEAKSPLEHLPAKRPKTSDCKRGTTLSKSHPSTALISRSVQDLEDPFRSPLQVATMLRVCASWGELLRGPDFDITPAMKLVATAWEVAPTPMIVAASFLGAIGHLGALQPSRPRVNEALYRAVVLREVTTRMRSPLTAASDMTISALMKLAAFEVCRLNPESATHISGLAKLLDLRNEKDTFYRNGTTMVVECLDLVQATLFNSSLVMVSSESIYDVESEDESDPLSRIAFMLTAELRNTLTNSKAFFATELVEDFAAVWKCAGNYIQSNTEREADRFFHCLEDFNSRHCESSAPTDQLRAARACHQSMAIWYNLIVNNHSFNDETNAGYVSGIYLALESNHLLWKRHSCFRSFLLWTGMLASRDPTTRSFFVAQVPGTVHTMGPPNWPKTKAFISDILKLRHQLENQAKCASPSPAPSSKTPNLESSQSPLDTSSSNSSTPHTPPPARLPTAPIPSDIKWQSTPRSTEEILASDHTAYNIISGGDTRRNLLGPFVSTLVTRNGASTSPVKHFSSINAPAER